MVGARDPLTEIPNLVSIANAPSSHSDSTKSWPLFWLHPCAQLVKTAELDPRQNYLVGFHPHGVLAVGAFINFCTEASGFSTLFPGITPHLLMLCLWFRVPFFRDYLMSGGKKSDSVGQCLWQVMRWVGDFLGSRD